LTGVVASVVYSVVGLPILLLFGAAQMEQAFSQANVDMPLSGIALIFLIWLIVVVLLLVFSVVGGLISSLVFKPTNGPTYPPAPGAPGAPGAPYGGQGF
jgi:hypothetical protein